MTLNPGVQRVGQRVEKCQVGYPYLILVVPMPLIQPLCISEGTQVSDSEESFVRLKARVLFIPFSS